MKIVEWYAILTNIKQSDAYGIALFLIALTTLLTTVIGFVTIFVGWKKVRQSRDRIKIKLETTFIFKSEDELSLLRLDTIFKSIEDFYNYLLVELTGTTTNSTSLRFTMHDKKNKYLRNTIMKAVDLTDSFLIKYDCYKYVLEDEEKYNHLLETLLKQNKKIDHKETYLEFRKRFFSDTLLLVSQTKNALKNAFGWQ